MTRFWVRGSADKIWHRASEHGDEGTWAPMVCGLEITGSPDVHRSARSPNSVTPFCQICLNDEPRREDVDDTQTKEEIENRFTYHPPKDGQTERYSALMDEAKALALSICEKCPPSRERSTALTHLDAVVMHANASIARHE